MEQDLYSEGNICSFLQEILRMLRKPGFHSRLQNSRQIIPVFI